LKLAINKVLMLNNKSSRKLGSNNYYEVKINTTHIRTYFETGC